MLLSVDMVCKSFSGIIFKNSKKFSTWILKGKMQAPNFFDAQRIHLIIDKMMISSKKKKKIYI